MTKKCLMLPVLVFATVQLFAQDGGSNEDNDLKQLLLYKKIFAIADSINKTGVTGVLSNEAVVAAASCDTSHPAKYLEKAAEMVAIVNMNDAAFLFYLGSLRYSYYNSANPAYEASADGALSASLSYALTEPINMYLRTNIDNYIAILQKSIEWYTKHDYTFYPKCKSVAKYNAQAEGINKLVTELQKNRLKYKKQWAAENKSTKEGFEKMLIELNKNAQY